MKTIEDVFTEWKKDCKISRDRLDDVSRMTPALHTKYLEALTHTKMRLRLAEQKQHSLLQKKFLYYNGKLSEDDIKSTGWKPDPFDGLKILKGDMDYYYNCDPDIQESVQRIEYYKAMIDALKEIVDSLKWRHQTIRNMIQWKQFVAGE